jgi:chromosome segregation ATPase
MKGILVGIFLLAANDCIKEYRKLQLNLQNLQSERDSISYQIEIKRERFWQAKDRCQEAEYSCQEATQALKDFNQKHGCTEMFGCIQAINRMCGYSKENAANWAAYGPTKEQEQCIKANQWLNLEQQRLFERKKYECGIRDNICSEVREIEQELSQLQSRYAEIVNKIENTERQIDRLQCE